MSFRILTLLAFTLGEARAISLSHRGKDCTQVARGDQLGCEGGVKNTIARPHQGPVFSDVVVEELPCGHDCEPIVQEAGLAPAVVVDIAPAENGSSPALPLTNDERPSRRRFISIFCMVLLSGWLAYLIFGAGTAPHLVTYLITVAVLLTVAICLMFDELEE